MGKKHLKKKPQELKNAENNVEAEQPEGTEYTGKTWIKDGRISEDFIEDVNEDPRVKLLQADFERQARMDELGIEEPVYGFWGKIYNFMNWYHSKTRGFRFKKKTYMLLMLFTGWAGGHRWYQGRRYLGLFETCLFWTGLPLIMCVMDFMEVVPLKPDEDGYVIL